MIGTILAAVCGFALGQAIRVTTVLEWKEWSFAGERVDGGFYLELGPVAFLVRVR